MTRAGVLGSILLLALSASALVPPAGACAPPCGPVYPIIAFQFVGWKGLTFGPENEMVKDGTISYYIDIDNEGWGFDPQNEPVLTFSLGRHPPWLETRAEPSEYVVPLGDPQYVGPENGDPQQERFLWTAPVRVTIHRVRDPSPDEIGPDSTWVRFDGFVPNTVVATSTESLAAPGVLGAQYGVQAGYGSQEFRFVPQIAGVQWLPDGDGVLRPENQPADPAAHGTPGPGAVELAVALVVAFVCVRRRR